MGFIFGISHTQRNHAAIWVIVIPRIVVGKLGLSVREKRAKARGKSQGKGESPKPSDQDAPSFQSITSS